MIEIIDLSVEINEKIILENISFSIENGIVAILGLNGCGKTTLLRSIMGLIKPNKGEIKVDHKSIDFIPRRELGKKIAYLPQESEMQFSYTVKEMLLMGRSPHINYFNFPSQHDMDVVFNCAEEIEISHLLGKQYKKLSGGEKKLTLIAMIFAQESEHIVLDEPTSFLDIYNSNMIIEKVQKLSRVFNKKIIIAMHDINQTLQCADKVFLMYDSRTTVFGNTHELISKQCLADLYKVDFEIIRVNGMIKYVYPSSFTSK